jgi:altronate dehydratase
MIDLDTVSRRAAPADNVVIATRTLAAGTVLRAGEAEMTLSHTVLEGHRFAIQALQPGDVLTSWGQPFGEVIRPILPGDILCNEAVLHELRRRSLDVLLPESPNFSDHILPFVFDESRFRPAPALPPADDRLTFQGYRRAGKRGVGTRNTIVLLGTSSLTGSFVRVIESQLKGLAAEYPNIDGIVAIAHTEGGTDQLNNRDLLLRTLAGLVVHPNVGAVLIVDRGTEVVNNTALRDYMEQTGYPLSDVIHHFMTLSRSFQDDVRTASTIVRDWLEPVNAMTRSEEAISELRIGMQCGGSDAFSGISGNPLAAWVAKEIIRYGGSANLAETDELIGAETYIVSRARDIDIARKFLRFVERFKTWTSWHGQSADGNPSGGNLYRGLYNIYLKSLGAAAKLHPDLSVDAVIDYAEPMSTPGFYFMDSPGNDLESVCGQVASGCNLIFFVTGNGSITNFPFVPTIKIITTTERYRLLSDEMDVNAGAYLDGTPMEELGAATLRLSIDVASGRLSVGEQAKHTQVQIWRDWRQTDSVTALSDFQAEYSGEPLTVPTDIDVPMMRFPALHTEQGWVSDQVGLILPTSLCSGQIARMCADWLNEHHLAQTIGVSRFVALVHTEGCGASTVDELLNTLIGYATHPLVKHALLLEHGCEKTHNGYFRQLLVERGFDPARFGWASIQLDGGIQNVMRKMIDWFEQQPVRNSESGMVGLEALRMGWVTQGNIDENVAVALATLTRLIIAAGGTVVLPHNDPLLAHPGYQRELTLQPQTTLAYAQKPCASGLHIMDMPTRQWGEILTGLGASGVELIVSHIGQQPMFGHPLIPVLQITTDESTAARYPTELDGIFTPDALPEQLLNLMTATLAKAYVPRLTMTGNTDFQITRGLLGISL